MPEYCRFWRRWVSLYSPTLLYIGDLKGRSVHSYLTSPPCVVSDLPHVCCQSSIPDQCLFIPLGILRRLPLNFSGSLTVGDSVLPTPGSWITNRALGKCICINSPILSMETPFAELSIRIMGMPFALEDKNEEAATSAKRLSSVFTLQVWICDRRFFGKHPLCSYCYDPSNVSLELRSFTANSRGCRRLTYIIAPGHGHNKDLAWLLSGLPLISLDLKSWLKLHSIVWRTAVSLCESRVWSSVLDPSAADICKLPGCSASHNLAAWGTFSSWTAVIFVGLSWHFPLVWTAWQSWPAILGVPLCVTLNGISQKFNWNSCWRIDMACNWAGSFTVR